jgi:hypothetical protein
MAPPKKTKSSASKKKDAASSSSSKKKDTPSAFLKNKSNKDVSALLLQQSDDWHMKVAVRFMGVKSKEEELLDPHAIAHELQQGKSELADAWKVVEDAADASTILPEKKKIIALTATCHGLQKDLEMTQKFIKDAREVKRFAKKAYARNKEENPTKAFEYLHFLKHATAVDVAATVFDDKFACAQLAAKKHAEDQVAEEQAALEEEVIEVGSSDESGGK